MIVPIFIHTHERSDKEIREEMERNARWEKMMREEEEMAERRKREEKERKRREKEERIRRFNEEYEEDRRKNPWNYQILPEGWSIFGTGLQIISEY